MKEQLISPDEYNKQQQDEMTPNFVHMATREIALFNELQGGQEDHLNIDLPSFYAFYERIKSDPQFKKEFSEIFSSVKQENPKSLDADSKSTSKLISQVNPLHYKGIDQRPKDESIEDLEHDGEGEDDQIAVMPYGLTVYLDNLLGGEPDLNTDGLKQYKSLWKKIKQGVRVALTATLGYFGGPVGAAVGAGVGDVLFAKNKDLGSVGKNMLLAAGSTYGLNKLGGLEGMAAPSSAGSFGNYASSVGSGIKSGFEGLNPFSSATTAAQSLPNAGGASLWEGGVGPTMQANAGQVAGKAASKTAFDNIDKLLMGGTALSLLKARKEDKINQKRLLSEQQKQQEKDEHRSAIANRYFGMDKEYKRPQKARLKSFLLKPYDYKLTKEEEEEGVEYPHRFAKGGIARKKYAEGGLTQEQEDFLRELRQEYGYDDNWDPIATPTPSVSPTPKPKPPGLENILGDLDQTEADRYTDYRNSLARAEEKRNNRRSFIDKFTQQFPNLNPYLDQQINNNQYVINDEIDRYGNGEPFNDVDKMRFQDYLSSAYSHSLANQNFNNYRNLLLDKYKTHLPPPDSSTPNGIGSEPDAVYTKVPKLNLWNPNLIGPHDKRQQFYKEGEDRNYKFGKREWTNPKINLWDPNAPTALKTGGKVKEKAEFSRNHENNGPPNVRFISGKGKGQADLVMDDYTHDGSYVIDATTTAHTGDGSSKAGYLEWKKLEDQKKYNLYKGGPITKTPIVPAALSDSEIVLNTPLVTAIGDGSNKRGASVLDRVVKLIRKDKAKNGLGLPPKAKPINHYINLAKKVRA